MVLKIHNNNKECQDGKFLYFARGIIYNDYTFSVTIYNTSITTNINEINNICTLHVFHHKQQYREYKIL